MRRSLLPLLVLLSGPALAGEVRGRLLSEGKPVAGVTVSAVPLETPFEVARREARREEPPKPLGSATTRPDGGFALPLPAAAGLVRLAVAEGGAVPQLLPDLADGSTGEDLGDLPIGLGTTALAGRVVDGQGGPVVGAPVTLWPGGSGRPTSTTTGKDGAFRFEAAGERGNRLRAEMAGFASADVRELRAGALRAPVRLTAGRSVSGSVLLPDGKTPAGGVAVRAEAKDLAGRFVETRPDGTFTLDGLPAGELRLVAEAGERGQASLPLPGSGRPRLVLTAPARIGGRVVDTRKADPVAGARVVARSEGGPFVVRSGADGRYELRGLPPGAWRIEVDETHHVPWRRDSLRLAPGGSQTLDVPLRPASSLSGRVVDEAGLPIAEARLQVLPGDPASFRNVLRAGRSGARGSFRSFRSGHDGGFAMTRLDPGTNFTLVARHEDYEPRSLGGVTLPAGAAAKPVTLALRRGPLLQGLVEDEAGHPLAGVEVGLSQALSFQGGRAGVAAQFTVMGGPGERPRRTTGPDGRFEFRGSAAGNYTLTASKQGRATARIEPVKLEDGKAGEPLRIVLQPGAAIRGVVRDRSGNPAPGWTVFANIPGAGGRGRGLGPGSGPRPIEPTGADGSFEIEGLETGQTYDVVSFGESGPGPRKPGLVAPAEDVELVVPGKGRIRGTVTDAETGKPVTDFNATLSEPEGGPGMRIRIRMGSGRGRGPDEPQAVHSDDGTFTLEDVAPGRWDVEVSADRYQRARVSGITVEEGGTAEGADVKLSHGGLLFGRVVDASSGAPILDATVSAELAGAQDGPRFFLDDSGPSTRSDVEGRYELPGLAPGTWLVKASQSDYAEGSTQVALKELSATADVKLTRGSVLAGAVVDRGGQPVAGAAVVAGDGGGFRGLGSGPHGLSDEAGRFRFERQAPGRYTLQASLRGENSLSVDVVLQPGQSREDVVLTLAAGATVRGRVSGLPESARAAINVNASGADSYFAATRTGTDGSFELGGVPVGPLSLRASAGDFNSGMRTASAQIVIAEGQAEATAEIVFPAGFRISGRVARGGAPVADALVMAQPSTPGLSSANGRTDESGTYALEGLQEGSYTLFASTQDGKPGAHREVTLTGDSSIDLEVPEGKLAGTVVEAGTRRPLADATVELEDQAPGRLGHFATTTDVNGHFVLDGLEPKTYRLVARKPAFEAETRSLDASTPDEVQIELRRGEGLGLQARDGIHGTPLRSLLARVLDAAGTAVFTGEVPLDSEGRGEVPSLKPGVYQLRADAGGYAPATFPGVPAPASGLVISLTPGGTLEIQVGPETLARPDAAARLLLPGGQPYLFSVFTQDGLIRLPQPVRRLENVGPGSYTLEVVGGPSRPVEIREGALSTVAVP